MSAHSRTSPVVCPAGDWTRPSHHHSPTRTALPAALASVATAVKRSGCQPGCSRTRRRRPRNDCALAIVCTASTEASASVPSSPATGLSQRSACQRASQRPWPTSQPKASAGQACRRHWISSPSDSPAAGHTPGEGSAGVGLPMPHPISPASSRAHAACPAHGGACRGTAGRASGAGEVGTAPRAISITQQW